MKSHINNQQSDVDVDKGFTFIEVLVAAAIMAIVVALAGTAFVGILQQNRKAEFESERRTNLNRALDYIANEVRMARTVAIPTVSPTPTTSPATTISSGTGVLRLTIPIPNPESGLVYNANLYTVVYYTSDSWTGWDSPKSIWRYSNISNPVGIATSASNPIPTPAHTAAITVPTPSPTSTTTLNHNFLIDGIKAPATPPSCPTPMPTPTPTLVGSNGFYACIYSGGKKADLFLYGKLSNDTNDPRTLEVKTTVFTRNR